MELFWSYDAGRELCKLVVLTQVIFFFFLIFFFSTSSFNVIGLIGNHFSILFLWIYYGLMTRTASFTAYPD